MKRIELFRQMTRLRCVELALADLWERGLISGEMHLGTGEEGIAVGLARHLEGEDMVALDHRPTTVMVAMGYDLVPIFAEVLGREEGMCHGRGGHMHLFGRDHRAASSGIVGASAPIATGFAMATRRLRPGSVAAAFFGDGAINQGQVLESLNLASVWNLPVVFVCKDNGWAITTRSGDVTAGDIARRAEAFELEVRDVDGADVELVSQAAEQLISGARRGTPGFLRARCARFDGHLLGDPMLKTADRPIREGRATFQKVLASVFSSGGDSVKERAGSMLEMIGLLRSARSEGRAADDDPIRRIKTRLDADPSRIAEIEAEAIEEVQHAVATALEEVPS